VRFLAAALALTGLVALPACAVLEPLIPQTTASPPSSSGPLYESYVGRGEVPVYGVSTDDPGPRIFIEIVRVPRLSAFLRQQGVPDFLEVTRADTGETRIELTYQREANPPSRRVVVESVEGQLTAYAPTRLDGSPLFAPRPDGHARPDAAPGRRQTPQPERVPATQTPAPGVPDEETGSETVVPMPALEPPPPDVPLATELQILECPIDPERPDCVELCVPGSPYEWCPRAPGDG
jgi:hypothetical protein